MEQGRVRDRLVCMFCKLIASHFADGAAGGERTVVGACIASVAEHTLCSLPLGPSLLYTPSSHASAAASRSMRLLTARHSNNRAQGWAVAWFLTLSASDCRAVVFVCLCLCSFWRLCSLLYLLQCLCLCPCAMRKLHRAMSWAPCAMCHVPCAKCLCWCLHSCLCWCLSSSSSSLRPRLRLRLRRLLCLFLLLRLCLRHFVCGAESMSCPFPRSPQPVRDHRRRC